MIKIYTDGSCLKNPGSGGWAAVIIENGQERVISGSEKYTTNNQMELLATIKTLEEFSKRPGKLALIPTMGNLHDGHLSLIKLAKLKASKTITTIFVNPLQFGKNEDFKKYPRSEKLDIEKLKKEHCDILFIPRNGEEVFSKLEKVKTLDASLSKNRESFSNYKLANLGIKN